MRGFLITIVLGLGVFAGAAWYLDLFASSPDSGGKAGEDDAERAARVARELGPELYPPAPLPAPAREPADAGQLKDPIVIDGHLVVTEKQEVPSKRAGQILFIGEEIPNGALVPPGQV